MRTLILLGLCGLFALPVKPVVAQDRSRSPHGSLEMSCTTCHRSDGWTPVKISRSFDHGKQGFPLAGAHGSATCRACHSSLDFKGTGSTCASCHKDVHRGELGADCSRCHTARSFLDRSTMARAHQLTRFPLEGAHLTADCTSCHSPAAQGGQQFVATQTTCVGCHQADYAGAKDPDHTAGGFPRECAQCHTVTVWSRARFDHDASRFPLTGAHRAVQCVQCHTANHFTGLRVDCVGCHQLDYNQAATPNHVQAGLPTDCVACHATASWAATYDHNKTQFPLTGAHRATSCAECHGDGMYRGKPSTCTSCHQTDFNGAKTPNHVQAQFSNDCTICHTTTAWQPAPFDHGTTQFALTGAHRAATCSDCHADGVYKGKLTTCVSCHQTDFNGAQVPNHVQAQFPNTCATCHSTSAWQPAPFDHNTTKFALTGAHRAATCNDCHADGVYKGKLITCISCHQTDFNGTRTPNHATSLFPTDCTPCHTTTAWTPATFNHSTTLFPLTGAHNTATCNDCHADGVYKGKPTACQSCHLQDFNSTTSPNHPQLGWPQTCITCHSGGSNTTAWDAGVTLPTQYHTMFSVTHEKARGDCTQCHLTTNYSQSTCSTHHHPPTCTYLNRNSCD
jgi:nitrate/TMAO reductase-like tetraheme cytochrome c subunit